MIIGVISLNKADYQNIIADTKFVLITDDNLNNVMGVEKFVNLEYKPLLDHFSSKYKNICFGGGIFLTQEIQKLILKSKGMILYVLHENDLSGFDQNYEDHLRKIINKKLIPGVVGINSDDIPKLNSILKTYQ